MENGALEESLADAAHVAINWSVTFYPAGTTGEYADAEHTNSENTIVIWTSNMSSTDVFVEDNGSDKESTTHDPSWNDQKDQELAACMEQFGHTMDQSYERYTGDHELKTYVGETYPAALKSTVVDGQKGQIGWSPTGKGSYAYNVVAVYNHNPVPKSQIGRITYAFAFHNGQPVVLVDQSTNGDPTMQVTKNDKLKTAFANIADNR
ncbi:DUF4767 domain-containing protein [Levilactobacillus bambusae]|uniref:DUF4767 domain-containing protein n=2 Tax=Levilactobacillus bambusae TaxID=2024736 RepID=A0A2V1N368_9LACO|nr:DUF4767 domain-containing protein [Levilactobacillus bambusae]